MLALLLGLEVVMLVLPLESQSLQQLLKVLDYMLESELPIHQELLMESVLPSLVALSLELQLELQLLVQ